MRFRVLFVYFIFTNCILSHAQSDQELVWGSYYGAEAFDFDRINSIAEIENGSFVIYGATDLIDSLSHEFFSTPGSFQEVAQIGTFNTFLAYFNSDKERVWGTYFSGNGIDTPRRVYTLSDGSVVIVGTTSSDNLATTGSFQATFPENIIYGGFIARLDSDGIPMWCTYLSGTGMNTINSISDVTVTSNDDVIVVGSTGAMDFPVTPGVIQPEYGGGIVDGFVTRFDANGELIWSTYFGSTGNDVVTSVKVDEFGDIIIVGVTESTTNIATPGAYQEALSGESDCFLTKMTGSGELVWSTYVGGENEDMTPSGSILVEENGDILIVGNTQSTTGIATEGAFQEELTGDAEEPTNVFLSKYSSNGNRIWGTYFGSSSTTSVKSIDRRNDHYIMTGEVFEDPEIVIGAPWLSENSSTIDEASAFIVGFNNLGFPQWGTYYGGEYETNPSQVSVFSNDQIAIVGRTNSNTGITTPDSFQPNKFPGSDGFISFFNINFGTGLSEKENLSLSVFPNPTTSHIHLQLPPEFAFWADVVVYNAVGKVVARNDNFNSLDPLPMNHPPGLYLVEARSNRQVVRGKVMVE